MKDITVIGIDLAKAHWQLHGVDSKGEVLFRKTMKPEKAAVFLASPMADYITGTTLHVNGGMFMS